MAQLYVERVMATEPHAVRWAQREILGSFEMQYSKWHWTLDASLTLCNRPIQLIADGTALLPETHDDPAKVTCKRCAKLLSYNASLTGGRAFSPVRVEAIVMRDNRRGTK